MRESKLLPIVIQTLAQHSDGLHIEDVAKECVRRKASSTPPKVLKKYLRALISRNPNAGIVACKGGFYKIKTNDEQSVMQVAESRGGNGLSKNAPKRLRTPSMDDDYQIGLLKLEVHRLRKALRKKEALFLGALHLLHVAVVDEEEEANRG